MPFRTSLLLSFLVLLGAGCINDALAQDEYAGLDWRKTIRIRGLMEQFDLLNESHLYSLGELPANEIPVNKQYVHFGMLANNFWVVLRDSLIEAIRRDAIDVYTVRPSPQRNRENIFVRGTKVTYRDLVDSLIYNFGQFARGTNATNFIYNAYDQYNRQQAAATIIRLINSPQRREEIFKYLSSYELEIELSIDETGMLIAPKSIMIQASSWTRGEFETTIERMEPEEMRRFDPLKTNILPVLSKDYKLAFMIDMESDKTMRYLIENGVQYSGERNVIPFYDLLVMFHYRYKIYSESNTVLAAEAEKFGNKYQLENLEQTILNRYHDIIYQNLYGQPPGWWDMGGKGGFTSGMYEIKRPAEKPKDQ